LFALSSLERLRRYTDLDDTTANNRLLSLYLTLTSRNIEKYCSTSFQKKSRTEYFDVKGNRIAYFPSAIPVSSITSVYSDTTGLYSGGESALSDYYIGVDDRSVVLDYPQVNGKKALRLIYTGGISEHGTQSIFTLSGVSGTFTKDRFINGSISGAVGIVAATTAASPITINTLYGVFEIGDVLAVSTTEGGTAISNISATIATITQQSLAEVAPEVNMACEFEVRYMFQHKDNFEDDSTSRDSSSFSTRKNSSEILSQFILQPHTRSLLQGYRRYFL